MSRIPSRGNERTERRLIEVLTRNRITGWRRHRNLLGRPDFTFTRDRVCVFVDGCFWHNCPAHGRLPTSNSEYWAAKLKRNRLRDRSVSQELRGRGWTVVRFWQHELLNEDHVVRKLNKAFQTALNRNIRKDCLHVFRKKH